MNKNRISEIVNALTWRLAADLGKASLVLALSAVFVWSLGELQLLPIELPSWQQIFSASLGQIFVVLGGGAACLWVIARAPRALGSSWAKTVRKAACFAIAGGAWYWRAIKPIAKPILALGWWLTAKAVLLLSFGAVDLKKKKLSKGAVGRAWKLFYPFLISREPWPIVTPHAITIPIPRFNGWSGGFGVKKLVILLAYSAAAALFVDNVVFSNALISTILGGHVPNLDLHAYLGSWFLGAEIAVGIFLGLSIFRNLPIPTWTWSTKPADPISLNRFGLRLPQALVLPVPARIAGKTLCVLPELVKAWTLLGLVGLGIYLVNYYAAQMNGLNGQLLDSITGKDAVAFNNVIRAFAVVLGIFVVLGPVYKWVQQLVILEWTKSSTRDRLKGYTKDRNFYPISVQRKPDNPNERIQQDTPAVCQAAMSFLLEMVDSAATFFVFGGILWKAEVGLDYNIPVFGHTFVVQHLLLLILIAYSILGSNGVGRVGKRLIGLQREGKQLGADFRVGLVMVEKYAEQIAAYHGEQREYDSLWRKFMLSMRNNYAIIHWQRNLGFFTSGYSRVAALLPYVALAPFYFAGQIKAGVISNASGAFGEILSSASIFVNNFSSLTGLMASVDRVTELEDTYAELAAVRADGKPRIKVTEGTEGDELLKIADLTLMTPDGEKMLFKDFNLVMKRGSSVAVIGSSGTGKTSLERAIAGLPSWDRGQGQIRVTANKIMLTQLAYLPGDASLKEQMLYPSAKIVSDDKLLAVLKQVNLGDLAERIGGLDAKPNWDKLSGGERQRLVVARALVNEVDLVLADEITSGLDVDNEENIYRQLMAAGITMLSVTHKAALIKYHERVAELLGDGQGGWRIMPASESPLHE